MQVVASLPYYPIKPVVTGDADHDGLPECYLYSRRFDTVYAVECSGGNQFIGRRIGSAPVGRCVALGDFDLDSKTDLFCRYFESQQLRVLESIDSLLLPDTIVWQETVPWLAGDWNSQVVDMDVDSSPELITETNSRVRAYECGGDNDYRLAYFLPNASHYATLFCRTFDLDRDGKPEIAGGSDYGAIAFYEAVMDDSVRLVAVCSVPGYNYCRAMIAAPDIDKNGRSEVLALSLSQSHDALLSVFESPADDSFCSVTSIQFGGSYFGSHDIAVGDVNGDSMLEIAVADGAYLRIFRCTGPGRYEQVWLTDYNYEAVGLSDLNTDGRAELICDGGNFTTNILECLPVGLERRAEGKLRRAEIQPSVVRSRGSVQITGLPPSSEIEVVDASGRVDDRPVSGVWHPAYGVAGTFFIRIRLGNQSVVRKLLVVE